MPSYETVSIDSTDDIKLSAWWMENDPQAKTVVVIPVSYTHLTLPTIYSV